MTRIRLAAHQAKGSSRTPFVVLVVGLLGGGLLSLLLLNTALNQGSFELGKLQKREDQLTDDKEALQRELDAKAAPGELARRAQEMGMVPGGSLVFVDPVTGQVLGVPKPATSKPPLVPEPRTTPTAPVPPTTPATVPPAAGGGPGAPAQAGPEPAAAGAAPPAAEPAPTASAAPVASSAAPPSTAAPSAAPPVAATPEATR